jgi:hypothetical protein
VTLSQPPFAFVLIFLLFSFIFMYNTYKLWFRTDAYYRDLHDSLTRSPSLYPFRDFFLRQMENRRRWELVQKIFSIFGLIAVLAADALILATWLTGRS